MVVLLFAIRGEWSPLAIMLVSAAVVGCIAAVWAYTVRRLDGPVWLAWLSALLLASPGVPYRVYIGAIRDADGNTFEGYTYSFIG